MKGYLFRLYADPLRVTGGQEEHTVDRIEAAQSTAEEKQNQIPNQSS